MPCICGTLRYDYPMYIETVPNRSSPPAILLRESYREHGKVRKRTLANLSGWPAEWVEAFRTFLRGGIVVPAGQEPFAVVRSLPHGHVTRPAFDLLGIPVPAPSTWAEGRTQ